MNPLSLRRGRPWDLADPASRRTAWLHYHLQDHAILRRMWTNMAEVAPGVWRSNHPTHARLAGLAARGIRHVLNLRGVNEGSPYLFERESCEALGIGLVSVPLRARQAPEREAVLALFDAFRVLPRPFLMHCKSGADRAGFAAALYLLREGRPLAEARRQLHWRFLHLRASRTGVLDHILDLYGARHAQAPVAVEDWFREEYDARAAQRSFDG